jgi:hypothetical protein
LQQFTPGAKVIIPTLWLLIRLFFNKKAASPDKTMPTLLKTNAWQATYHQFSKLESFMERHNDERKTEYAEMLGLLHAFLAPDIKDEDMKEVSDGILTSRFYLVLLGACSLRMSVHTFAPLIQRVLLLAQVFSWFGLLSCNGVTICDGELQPYGLACYPLLSMINHSCDPNCVLMFDRNFAQVC